MTLAAEGAHALPPNGCGYVHCRGRRGVLLSHKGGRLVIVLRISNYNLLVVSPMCQGAVQARSLQMQHVVCSLQEQEACMKLKSGG